MANTAFPPTLTLVSLRFSCGSQKSPVFANDCRISVRAIQNEGFLAGSASIFTSANSAASTQTLPL